MPDLIYQMIQFVLELPKARIMEKHGTWHGKTGLPKEATCILQIIKRDGLMKGSGPHGERIPFLWQFHLPTQQICYTTDFGRTIRTADGGKTWEQLYTNRKEGAGWISRGLEVTTGYTIVSDPFDIKHMFIANTDIGLMESNDGGESWMSATVNNGIPRKWINSTYWLAFDPDVKGGWMGCDEQCS